MLQQSMGNLLACHSSSADATNADIEALSAGPDEMSQPSLARSCSEEAKNPPSQQQQAPQSTGDKILAVFKKNKKNKNKKNKNQQSHSDGESVSSSSSSTPVKPVMKPAAAVVKPAKLVIDDRSRFGLAPLPTLGASKFRYFNSLAIPALLGELGAVTGIKSVKRAELERLAREAELLLKKEEEAEAELLKKAQEAAESPQPVSASAVPAAVPAPVVNADFVLGENVPAPPPMTLDTVFAPSNNNVNVNSNSNNNNGKQIHWAKGTGYGHYGQESNWTMESYMNSLKQKQQQIQFICRKLSDRLVGKDAENVSAEYLSQTTLLPFLESYLRNDSMNEIFEQHAELYSDIFHLVAYFLASGAPQTSPYVLLFEGKLAGFIKKIAKSAEMVEKLEKIEAANPEAAKPEAAKPLAASSSSSSAPAPATPAAPVFTITSFVIELNRTLEDVLALKAQQAEEAKKAAAPAVSEEIVAVVAASSSSSVPVPEPSTEREDSVSTNSNASSASSVEDKEETPADAAKSDQPSAEVLAEYAKALSAHRFGEIEEFDYHKYQKQHGTSTSSAPISRAFTRRLAVEFADLNESLPIHYESSVWMRVHETKMQYAQMMISGPTGTPYESGLFLFDVHFGSQYPNSPPEVNLQTTGNGSVRFNPNLYACGKVCLSLLGTWSGGAGEGWSAKNSTMLQVGVSIQSLIFVPQPYFNEPGYESSINTKEGQSQSDAYSSPLLKATAQFAMLQMMEKPPKGFEAVVSSHFALKKDSILKQMESWKTKNAEIGTLIPQLKAALEKQKVVA